MLRSGGCGGWILEWAPLEGAEGSGHERRHGQEAEGGQRAEHEREEQQNGQLAGARLGGAASVRPGLDGHALEAGGDRGPVPHVVEQHVHERVARLAPGLGQVGHGGVGPLAGGEGVGRSLERGSKRRRTGGGGDRQGCGHRESGAGRQHQQIGEFGEVVDDGALVDRDRGRRGVGR